MAKNEIAEIAETELKKTSVGRSILAGRKNNSDQIKPSNKKDIILAIIDTETTGLVASKEKLTELAIVYYSCKYKNPIKYFSVLINEPNRKPIRKYIVNLGGISDDMLNDYGVVPNDKLFNKIDALINKADYCVAHNSHFDKGMIEEFYKRYNKQIPTKKWICTQRHIDYPKHIKKGRDLISLAAYHKFLNPFPHRALPDCQTVIKILQHYDTSLIVKNNNDSIYKVIVKIDYEEEDLREQIKSYDFRWNKDLKSWIQKKRKDEIEYLPIEIKSRIVDVIKI